MTQGIHQIGHLDNLEVEIVYATHSSVGVLDFLVLLVARIVPIRLDIVKTRLLGIARDKTIGATVDPSELLGPTR